jgi:hypothetical protein
MFDGESFSEPAIHHPDALEEPGTDNHRTAHACLGHRRKHRDHHRGLRHAARSSSIPPARPTRRGLVQEEPENIDGQQVTPGYDNMLGRPFFLGRDFLPEEGPVGKDHEAILTHKLWSHLGADPKLVGHTMRINSEL